MSQPSVASYFNTRKRQAAIDSLKQTTPKKVLILDQNETEINKQHLKGHHDEPKIIVVKETTKITKKGQRTTQRTRKKDDSISNQPDIKQFVQNICEKTEIKAVVDREAELKTPPGSPVIINAMDKVKVTGKEINFNEIKQKLSRSSRLAELKASLSKFKEKDAKLKEIEKKNEKNEIHLNLKEFKKIELEVCLSPTKTLSPQKQYLSPKKDTTARKNLLNLLSPTRNAVALPPSPLKSEKEESLSESFTLPFKYKCLLEIFRGIDIACQILFNRKETITFRKLKSAVEEMLKRNLFERHLAQIATIYPKAFSFVQEKLRVFGLGVKENRWELVVKPGVEENMSSDVLLERRRKFNRLLIEKVHQYHDEFLKSVGLNINKEKLKRWHPEFSLETVPDIECEKLPEPPQENKVTTGKEVLEKAKDLFKCNSRMEAALQRLSARETKQVEIKTPSEDIKNPLLKGIPKAILEKVRQKQAAKALENMTRSTAKDKEVQIYKKLPEIARLTRNIFVSERKNVLPLEVVVEKLGNSCRTFNTKTDLEGHLKALTKEMPNWLILHEMRQSVFVKISKDMDLSVVISRLEAITKAKIES
ncbi:DNA replication factor Cdt1 [Onthophagus taurus]|uniref:DNA replication factor Cdt1 n=1 Tax=Onthophagus taurus TaxID=166361 RepID=UPI0039BEC8FA